MQKRNLLGNENRRKCEEYITWYTRAFQKKKREADMSQCLLNSVIQLLYFYSRYIFFKNRVEYIFIYTSKIEEEEV